MTRGLAAMSAILVGLWGCTHPSLDRRDAGGWDASIDEDASAPLARPDAAPWATDPDICPEQPPAPCAGAACATSERAAHLLELWWQAKREVLDATPEEIAAVVEVHAADLTEGPDYVFFRVIWVARVGWASSMVVEVIPLGDYPLPAWPDDGAVLQRLRDRQSCAHLPRSVISFEAVGARARACFPKGVATSCRVKVMDPPACILEGFFGEVIDYGGNRCFGAVLDLETGDVRYCGEFPCSVSNQAG